MRREEDCKPQERYLFTDQIYSDEAIAIVKKQCIALFRDKNNDEAYHNFINWKRCENEIALFTMYAYATLEIPKTFDCIFNLDEPSNFIVTSFTLNQSINEGMFPIELVSRGYQHLCVFEFQEGIPEMIKKLYVVSDKRPEIPKGSLRLGLCQSADFDSIIDSLNEERKNLNG